MPRMTIVEAELLPARTLLLLNCRFGRHLVQQLRGEGLPEVQLVSGERRHRDGNVLQALFDSAGRDRDLVHVLLAVLLRALLAGLLFLPFRGRRRLLLLLPFLASRCLGVDGRRPEPRRRHQGERQARPQHRERTPVPVHEFHRRAGSAKGRRNHMQPPLAVVVLGRARLATRPLDCQQFC
jgi:hypothetical protein